MITFAADWSCINVTSHGNFEFFSVELRHCFLLWCRMLSGSVTPQHCPLPIPPQLPCHFYCQLHFNSCNWCHENYRFSFVQYSSDPLDIILNAKKLKHESCEENLTGVWAFDYSLQTMSCVLKQTFQLSGIAKHSQNPQLTFPAV